MEYLICKICNKKLKSLITHIIRHHNISLLEYKEKFGECKLHLQPSPSKETRIKISEKGKSFWKKNKKRMRKTSKRCIEYWLNNGYLYEDAKKQLHDYQKIFAEKYNNKYTKEEKKQFSYRCKEYWIKKGLSNDEAKLKEHEIQSGYSNKSKKFLDKNHTIDSKTKISENMSKYIKNSGKNWLSHFGSLGKTKSKSEIDLFNYIKENINENVESNKNILGKIPDIVYKNKIIEFFGDFWHCNPIFFDKNTITKFGSKASDVWAHDKKRIKYLNKNGYATLIIWENDWINNKENVIKKIRDFLYD